MSQGGGGGAGKVSMQRLPLHDARLQGESEAPSGLRERRALPAAPRSSPERRASTQQKFLKIKFTDLLVSSFDTGPGDPLPIDSISLNFTKIEYEYSPQDAKGSLGGAIRAGWDLKKNVKA